jgi:hypothetical protein
MRTAAPVVIGVRERAGAGAAAIAKSERLAVVSRGSKRFERKRPSRRWPATGGAEGSQPVGKISRPSSDFPRYCE